MPLPQQLGVLASSGFTSAPWALQRESVLKSSMSGMCLGNTTHPVIRLWASHFFYYYFFTFVKCPEEWILPNALLPAGCWHPMIWKYSPFTYQMSLLSPRVFLPSLFAGPYKQQLIREGARGTWKSEIHPGLQSRSVESPHAGLKAPSTYLFPSYMYSTDGYLERKLSVNMHPVIWEQSFPQVMQLAWWCWRIPKSDSQHLQTCEAPVGAFPASCPLWQPGQGPCCLCLYPKPSWCSAAPCCYVLPSSLGSTGQQWDTAAKPKPLGHFPSHTFPVLPLLQCCPPPSSAVQHDLRLFLKSGPRDQTSSEKEGFQSARRNRHHWRRK